MSICTLADIKDRIGIPTANTDNDATINTIISSLAAIFDTFTGRNLIVSAAVTEYYTCYTNQLKLKRYPVAQITSIKEAYDYDFDSKDALTANIDYRLINSGAKGIICRLYGTWSMFPDSVQVIYRGGYAAAGATPGTGETALPADLREAAIEQASFIYKRRNDIGLTAQSFDGGSIDKFSAMKLLPMAKDILDSYRRLTL